MIGLFSILPIIREHYKSVIEDSTKAGVLILFFGIPVVVSVILLYFDVLINAQFTQVMMSVLGVLVGFSINALILLIRYPRNDLSDQEERLINNTRNHTIYALVFGLGLLVIGTGFFLTIELSVSNKILNTIGSFILYSGGFHYIISLYLLPARLFVLAEIR